MIRAIMGEEMTLKYSFSNSDLCISCNAFLSWSMVLRGIGRNRDLAGWGK